LLIEISFKVWKLKHGTQRAGLYAGWELVFRLPITAAD